MSRFESLPEDVQSKLKTDIRYTSGDELLPAQVAEVLYEQDEPIWTASQLERELDTGHRTETIREKLDELVAAKVCNSYPANNGRIYWLDDARSDWPLPPDIDLADDLRNKLEERETELTELRQEHEELSQEHDELEAKITLKEALRTEYIQFVLLGLVIGFASALIFAGATLQAIGAIQTGLATATLLGVGLSALVVAFALFLLCLVSGAVAYAYGKPLFLLLAERMRGLIS